MKAVFFVIAALTALPAAALADTPKVIQGCEVKQAPNGNYYNLVEPTCLMSATDQGNGSSTYADFDNDPSTPDSFGFIER